VRWWRRLWWRVPTVVGVVVVLLLLLLLLVVLLGGGRGVVRDQGVASMAKMTDRKPGKQQQRRGGVSPVNGQEPLRQARPAYPTRWAGTRS
jgi:hypothetical protein